jgi:squalene synthase HpnC
VELHQKQAGGYNSAINFAKNHYENFPVISFLVPKELQKHIAVIYWFARTADDLADEGNFSEEIRLKNLINFEARLTDIFKGNFEHDLEHALKCTIEEKKLSPDLFYDLLSAFKQDVEKKSYKNYEEILDYCRRSANPIGRLILEIYNIRNEEAFEYSDMICTALQLTNFYQDVSIDVKKGRIYFAENEMAVYGTSRFMFENMENSLNLREFLRFNVERTEGLFEEGKKLLKYLNGRLKLEIKWTILGGLEVLKKIKQNNYDVFNVRPKLHKKDFFILLMRSFYK